MLLQDKLETLKSLDSKILELLENESSIQDDVLEASEITDKITWAMVRIDSKLKESHGITSVAGSSLSGNSSGNSNPITPNFSPSEEVHAKLPKLEMKRFNGEPTEWLPFIDCYDSAVHSNSKLSDIDKLNYLKSLLDGPAAGAIEGLTLSSTNYFTAREILQQRYGNKQLIISAHMEDLWSILLVMSMVPDNSMTK